MDEQDKILSMYSGCNERKVKFKLEIILTKKTLLLINQLTLQQFSPRVAILRPLVILRPMNDYKITLNKRQEHFLSRLLPKGYSFQLYKVRKNINDYPYKEFDKKYKKTDSVILSKRQSFMIDSLEPSQISFRQKSDVPSIPRQNLTPFQTNLLCLVRKLRKHQSSYPFRAPVDPKALQVPDYFDVVLQPIDLKKIEQEIRADHYHHVSEFQRDIYKMLMNSYKFNQKSTTTYNKTIQFQQFFTQTMKQWEITKEEQFGQPKDDNNQVKEEMFEENVTMTLRNEEIEKRLEMFNLWRFKENNPVPVAPTVPTVPAAVVDTNSTPVFVTNPYTIPIPIPQQAVSQKKDPRPTKISTEIGQQRPRVSKKKLPKIQQVIIRQLQAAESRQLQPPPPASLVIKRQQPQIFMQFQQQFFPIPHQPPASIIVSQPQQSEQPEIKKQQQQQINDQLRDYLQNETVKEQNFSQGYNEFTAGNKIRNIEVQKEITSLLKKLNEFPLTKQKKHKIISKFTNLQQNMTQTDKKKLFQKISKLDENDIEYVIRILTRGKHQLLKQDEFELDLDKADSKVLRQIQNFIAIRDKVTLLPIVQNGAIFPVSQSLQLIKVPKKIKKQQKKQIKKKPSRKNSNNDESFSINPPQIKKKKSQKPTKRQFRGDEQSSINLQINSANEQKESSSSYRPQALNQVRPATVQHINRHPQTEKSIHAATQQKQKPSQEEKKRQETKHQSLRYDQSQIFINPNPVPCHSTPYHYEPKDEYDIDQFLVSSSKHFPHDHQQSPQHGPFASGRKKRHSMDQLDLIYEHNFPFNKSGLKDYVDEEIKEYSMQERDQLQNDEDEFL